MSPIGRGISPARFHDPTMTSCVSSSPQRSRAPIQRLACQVPGWFVPVVMAIALVAFAAWMIWEPEPRLAFALAAAVTALIIACPRALGLATPMSIMVGVGRGPQASVLIKNAGALERIERIRHAGRRQDLHPRLGDWRRSRSGQGDDTAVKE